VSHSFFAIVAESSIFLVGYIYNNRYMDIASFIGSVAAVAIVLGYLPQTVQTLRTRSTDDISLGSFLLMALGASMFMVQGFLTGNLPLAIANLCTTTMSSIIFGIKLHNDLRKRREGR
jgi:MtN3 and saliva related transmembrane protein